MPGHNKTFCGAEPTWANACVGNNGLSNYWTYASGFSQAANHLIKSVLSDNSRNLSVDEYIYPVCFNMRHSVELCLKGAIAQLQTVSEIKGNRLEFNLSSSHDIDLIWSFLESESSILDIRYKRITKEMDSIIRDIGKVDPTGQTFRYPLSIDSKKHLTDVSVINFVVLYKSFGELEKSLSKLQELGHWLIHEYRFKSFTKNLSRAKLWELSRDLPPTIKWREASFDEIRAKVMERYGISSNELSKAINLIKGHYEFAPMIGESIPLLGIDDEKLVEFLDLSTKLNETSKAAPEEPIQDSSSSAYDFLRGVKEYSELLATSWATFGSKLTAEEIAGIRALFYFARDLDLSESYKVTYDHELSESKSALSRQNGEAEDLFNHILKKTNSVHNILKSLYFLKKEPLAEKIIERYGLSGRLSWVNEARNRTLFRKPDYYGYALESSSV